MLHRPILSVTQPVADVYRASDPRRRRFVWALAFALLSAETFTDTARIQADPKMVDRRAPVVKKITADPPVITVAHRRLVPVTISVAASDDVEFDPACRIESVSSNQPPSTPSGADWTIVEALRLYVRAERPSPSGPRVYTIAVRCTDRTGKMSNLGTIKVPVAPHRRVPMG